MQSRVLTTVLIALLLLPALASSTSGRDSPNCLQQDLADVPSVLGVQGGVCVKIALGQLTPGDVYDVEILTTSSIDILFFDQNGIQTYDLGQTYHNAFTPEVSTENTTEELSFHWQVPSSFSTKHWYLVVDNMAHDGDQGMGDQGGEDAQISLQFTKMNQAHWTPYHNVVALESDSYEVLLSGDDLRLDAGTAVVISAWELTGQADVYLQTRAMHDLYASGGIGQQYITGGALQGVSNSASLSWQVPFDMAGQELVLVADNTDTPVGGGDGSEDTRLTVRLELSPPLSPQIVDDSQANVAIGETITFNASSTPNLLGQVESLSWDFTANNGVTEVDATGWTAQTSWDTPGLKTIRLGVQSPDGRTAELLYNVTVFDQVDPVARISGDGQPVSNGWKVGVSQQITFNCDSSSDDHAIQSCSWNLDGSPHSTDNSISLSWDSIGTHLVELTVLDMSGNSHSVNTSVNIVDSTVPVLDSTSIQAIVLSGQAGDSISYSIAANDDYDGVTGLRYHWDLNPEHDSDNNGIPTDDPDFVGSSVKISFSKAGQHNVVVTVFDQSNNTDSYAFTVEVSAAPEPESSASSMMMGLVVLVALGALLVIGFNRLQINNAVQLLIGRGLSKAEALAHIANVKASTEVSLFSKSEDIAGLQYLPAQNEEQVDPKEAEMRAIYGDSSSVDPNAGFAPQQSFAPAYGQVQMGAGGQAAAAEAFAMLNDGPAPAQTPTQQVSSPANSLLSELSEPMPQAAQQPVQQVAQPAQQPAQQPAPQASVSSGGVSLPAGVGLSSTEMAPAQPAPAPSPAQAPAAVVEELPATTIRSTCNGCPTQFDIPIPAGAKVVKVFCPKCKAENLISR